MGSYHHRRTGNSLKEYKNLLYDEKTTVREAIMLEWIDTPNYRLIS